MSQQTAGSAPRNCALPAVGPRGLENREPGGRSQFNYGVVEFCQPRVQPAYHGMLFFPAFAGGTAPMYVAVGSKKPSFGGVAPPVAVPNAGRQSGTMKLIGEMSVLAAIIWFVGWLVM